MARWTKDEKAVATAATVGLGLLALYYLSAGAGPENNAALIPDVIEDRLDAVVKALDKKFGKAWVNREIATLKAGLSAMLPAPLVKLVDAVSKAEVLGRQNRWTGPQKRLHAVRLATA
jgi:hypothetical protein